MEVMKPPAALVIVALVATSLILGALLGEPDPSEPNAGATAAADLRSARWRDFARPNVPFKSAGSVKGELPDSVSEPMTEADRKVMNYANAWVNAVTSGDEDAASELVDGGRIFREALSTLNVPQWKQFMMSMGGSRIIREMSTLITSQIEDGGSYTIIDTSAEEGRAHVLFRLEQSNGGFNYHDILLEESQDAFVGKEIRIAVSGENLSTTLRRSLVPLLAAESSTFLGFSAESTAELTSIEQVAEMSNALAAGDYPLVLSSYQRLSEATKKTISPQLMRVGALAQLYRANSDRDGMETYLAAIDEFDGLFPGNAAVGFVLYDAAIIQEDEQLLMRSYAAMQEWTGGDPWLNMVTARVLHSFGNTSKAHEILRAAGDVDFGTLKAHRTALRITLAAEDHEATMRHLVRLKEQYHANLGAVPDLGGWDAFESSPQYRALVGD